MVYTTLCKNADEKLANLRDDTGFGIRMRLTMRDKGIYAVDGET